MKYYTQTFRKLTRSHVLAWRAVLEEQNLAGSSIRRKMSALSSLFDYLCEKNAVEFNPVKGAKRPKSNNYEGKTPAISDQQALALLNAPDVTTLKGKRDRAILSTFLYHALRREELCKLKVGDLQIRRGTAYIRVEGKGSKVRYVPMHPGTSEDITAYLETAGHLHQLDTPLFLPIKDSKRPLTEKNALTVYGVYKLLKFYARKAGINIPGICPHSLRATAATNALENNADIAEVQQWLGHADISTTRIYDYRQRRPENSPTFKVRY